MNYHLTSIAFLTIKNQFINNKKNLKITEQFIRGGVINNFSNLI
tara:strand:- start:260 stop:391 length:132 start_codon:yes stop_codon:yes gene_type:complete